MLGTVIFTAGVLIAVLNLVSQSRKKRRDEAAQEQLNAAPDDDVMAVESELNVAVR